MHERRYEESEDGYDDGNFGDVTDSMDYDNTERDEHKEPVKTTGFKVSELNYVGIDFSQIDFAGKLSVDNVNKFTDEDMKIFKEYLHGGTKEQKKFVYMKIIEALSGLIEKLIRKYGGDFVAKKPEYLEECRQECAMAIIDNIDRYNFKYAMTTFCTPILLGAITEYIRTEIKGATIILPKTSADTAHKVSKAINELESQGRDANAANVSLLTGIQLKKVEETMEIINMSIRLNYDPDALEAVIASNGPTPEQVAIQNEQTRVFMDAFGKLAKTDVEIFLLSKGLRINGGQLSDGYKSLSARQLAAMFHKQEGEITTIINRVKDSLKRDKGFRNFFETKKVRKESKLKLIPNAKADASLYDDFD